VWWSEGSLLASGGSQILGEWMCPTEWKLGQRKGIFVPLRWCGILRGGEGEFAEERGNLNEGLP